MINKTNKNFIDMKKLFDDTYTDSQLQIDFSK
jgi:hypothetical protein